MRSRFLPVDQLDDETFAPRIVQVAGTLSDVTVADIMAVGVTPAAELGMWQYDFSDPGGPQVRFMYVHVAGTYMRGGNAAGMRSFRARRT